VGSSISNYFEEAAGAGAGAADGQQEAANSDATAATIAILTSFIFGCSVVVITAGIYPDDVAKTNRS
jgi:hypothetical protein